MPGSNLLAVVYILPCIRCCWWIDQSMLLWRKCILNQTSLELVQASNAYDVCKHVWHLGTPNHHRHLEVRANVVKLQGTKQANCTADVWWAEVPHLPWGWSISWKWKWKKDNKVEIAESESGSRTTKLNTESYSWREGGARSCRDGWVQRPEQIQSHLRQPWSTKYFTAKYMKGGKCHLDIRGSETLTDSKS